MGKGNLDHLVHLLVWRDPLPVVLSQVYEGLKDPAVPIL